MWSLKCEVHSWCSHLEVEVEKDQHEVEYSTSGTRWRQMVTPTWYNYGNLIRLHALNESKKFLKRTEKHTSWVEECMVGLVGLP